MKPIGIECHESRFGLAEVKIPMHFHPHYDYFVGDFVTSYTWYVHSCVVRKFAEDVLLIFPKTE